MKKTAIIFKIVLFCLVIMSCSKDDDIIGVKVKFYNETGLKINELNIGNMDIGSLEIDSSTDYIIYEKFGFDTGMPDENCNGNIDNESIESYNGFYWCGTEKISLEEGTFEMSIKLSEIDSIKYFRIDMK